MNNINRRTGLTDGQTDGHLPVFGGHPEVLSCFRHVKLHVVAVSGFKHFSQNLQKLDSF